MIDKEIKVKFYFLCIVGRLHNDHIKISSEVRNKIDNIPLGDKKLLGSTFEQEGDKNDHESWYIWKGKIPITINNSIENCDIIIKHFKVRIIIEITRVYEDKDFTVFFKKARKERELLKNNGLIKKILEPKFLFDWNEIPGKDSDSLIEYLINNLKNFDVNWVKTAKIEKIDDGKTISISNEKHNLLLRLNDREKKVTLRINKRTDEFIVEEKKGKLCIYEHIIPTHVKKLYFYPFIQIFKEYKSADFNNFSDESITSFLYEIHDARRENIKSLFFWETKKTIVRVSRPSIIATEMSYFMQSEIVNAVYDTCLISLRKNDINEPSEEIFHEMRDHIGRVLFDHEETVASAELARSVNTLSVIMSIGAIAAILAIIYIISDVKKSLMGIILFVFTIIILSFFILSKKYK